MRRRLAAVLAAATLGAALLLSPAAAFAAPDSGALVLASEGHISDEGLEPMSPDDEENEFAPAEYEPNWTWRAGKVLFGAFLFVVAYVGLMYYLRVARFQRSERS